MATHEVVAGGGHKITDLLVEIEDMEMAFSNPVPVFVEGNPKQLGLATLRRTERGLLANVTLTQGAFDASLTPAVKMQVIKKVFDLGGKPTSQEGKIVALLLNAGDNGDKRIQSLAKQLKTK